jgi:hypothetical protein
MKHALFGQRLLRQFIEAGKLWQLLPGTTLWALWIARNNYIFNQNRWSRAKLESLIWNRFIEYGKAAWVRVCLAKLKSTKAYQKALALFNAT